MLVGTHLRCCILHLKLKEMIDIIIWALVVLVIVLGFYLYITRPTKCPYCGTRMMYDQRVENGKTIVSEYCPNCGAEIVLDVR